MAWPKGKPRPEGAGRKSGTPNKRTSVLERCEAIGLDPFAEMARIAADKADPNQCAMLREICQYIEPKRKAVEVSGSLDVHLQQELERLMKLPESELLEMLKSIIPSK